MSADESDPRSEESGPEVADEVPEVSALSPTPNGEEDEELEILLRFIRDTRGFDFTGYKRSSIGRRVRRRMQEVGYDSIFDYRALLEADVDEFTALFNTILINLTGFFRDAGAWKYLETHIVPLILERHPDDDPIRVWSAGCATGEEPYTLAMVFANALGINDAARRVKIYATDIDLDALAQARSGVYPEKSLADVPEEQRHQYFLPDSHRRGSVIIPPLRRTVVFGRLDLTRDPPISRVDLLACRNTLMYLNAETQSFVIPRLHYALRDGGCLFLGRAEMVLRGGAGRFTPISLKHRIFVAMPQFVPHPPEPPRSARRPFDIAPLDEPDRLPQRDVSLLGRADAEEFAAELLVDARGNLVGANEYAHTVLGLHRSDVARPFSELPIASSAIDLKRPLEEVLAEGRSRDLGNVSLEQSDGTTLEMSVRMLPIPGDGSTTNGVAITFADTRASVRLREGYRQMHEELETAYEELQSTNEELVTSNEELQSSYEELETSNEELQSANEELETTNEELRSSNEELEQANIDLKSTTEAVEHLNTTLVDANRELIRFSGLHRQVMDNFPAAIVVLNSHLLVEEWNHAATALWGLTEPQVAGEPFFGLDMGLPLERLQDPVRATRQPGATPAMLEVMATDTNGEAFTCRVKVLPVSGGQPETAAMLIMEDMREIDP
jgi:two-component system, chemotaxis family, CheB/CheR fusion protein